MNKKAARILPIFLLGNKPETLGTNKDKQELQADAILRKYRMNAKQKYLIRKDKDLLKINNHDADGFIIFPYTLQRFAPLIYLAETKKPTTIVSEEKTFLNALETYDYLSDHENVQLAFSQQDVDARIKSLPPPKWFKETKICIFDAGEWKLDGIAWQKNQLFAGKLNVENINIKDFLKNCKNADKTKAKRLAKQWMKEPKVLEPTIEDVEKCAQIYLAMKDAIKKMKAKAAYVLWCGQFTKPLDAKLCFALAKLAENGYPVGCWRGGNLLPMLILHTVSKKPVFTPEAFWHKGTTISVKHCFAPSTIGPCRYTLRKWRTMKGTVTGYCELPKGTATLINSGASEKIVVTKAELIDCKDLGGKNCRITAWIKIEDEKTIHKFVGREFAMVYGDYAKKAIELAEKLGIRAL